MTVREILQRRDAIRTEMRSLDTAANGGALGDVAQARWTVLEGELATLEGQERRAAALDDLDRRAAGQPLGDAQTAAFTGSVSLADAIGATLNLQTRGAGLAREASQEISRQRGKQPQGVFVSMGSRAAMERRAQAVTSGAQGTPNLGGALVPTVVRSDLLIDALRANLVLSALGVTYLTDLRGNVSVPRVATGTNVGWFGEDQPIPDTNLTLDSVGLQVKHVGAISEYSRTMLLNASPDVDALLRNDMMRALAVEIERAALMGSGDGIQPRGIINTPGVKNVPMGGTLTWPGVLALPAAVDSANVALTSPGFVGSGLIRAKAMGTLSSPGVASPFIMTAPGQLGGYPFAASNIIPVSPATTGTGAHPAYSTLVFGSWDSLLVGVWDALDLTSNPYSDTAYRKGSVQIRIIADLDVAVRHPEAFAFASDVAA